MADAIAEFLDGVESPVRRGEAEVLFELMSRATGAEPEVSGKGAGFGQYHYKYASGREGDAAATGFALGKAAISIYLMDGVGAHIEALGRLGEHTSGVGCLYIKRLERVDLAVLEEIVARSYRAVIAGDYYQYRARESAGQSG